MLDQVKQRRRVTWMLLFDKVQVLGLDGKVLTIGFADAGSVKGFAAGGHDEVLRLAIIDVVGADWTIDAVHQPSAAPADRALRPSGPLAPPALQRSTAAPPAADAAEEHPGEGEAQRSTQLTGADLVMRELGGRGDAASTSAATAGRRLTTCRARPAARPAGRGTDRSRGQADA